MSDMEWGKLLITGLTGGLVVKLLDILYQEVRRRSDTSQSARHFVDEHLDPLLKSADELVGKLRSLAEEDFRTLYDVNPDAERLQNNDFSSLIYLIAKLWANVEIIRHQGLSVSLVKDERGRRLQSFMDCLESRRVRIVDRISQRALGELMLSRRDGAFETLSFIEFVRLIEGDPNARRWATPVARILARMRHTSERQRLLQYGAVVHAMIDTLDPAHEATRKRPSYPNKLTRRSWRDLKHRVFGQYLTFVTDREKYLGPPKRGRP